MLIQLNTISRCFKSLGQVVGLPSDLLDKIESSAAVPYDGLVEVCDARLRKYKDDQLTLTWRNVAEALCLVRQEQLSQDIMKVYSTGEFKLMV